MIAWIDVQQRVPDNRRNVMAWGVGGFFVGGYQPERGRFLGKTKFNPTRDGGSFDVERTSRFTYCKVTHWAEIEGPDARSAPTSAISEADQIVAGLNACLAREDGMPNAVERAVTAEREACKAVVRDVFDSYTPERVKNKRLMGTNSDLEDVGAAWAIDAAIQALDARTEPPAV